MILFQECISLENIVTKCFQIVLVQSYDSVCSHDIDIRCYNSICTWNIRGKSTEVARSLLEIFEVLSKKLDRVLWSIFQQQGYSFFQVRPYILFLKVIFRLHQ